MNTPRDTDEGKATPSVWPVYVAVVAVLIIALAHLAMVLLWGGLLSVIRGPVVSVSDAAFLVLPLASAVFGLFGLVTASGLLQLRGWGWWCGSVFAGIWIVGGALPILGLGLVEWAGSVMLPAVCLGVAVLGLLVARRRLFFPPKQEGEE